MTFTPEFVLQLIVAVSSGAGVYAALRADLARLHERTEAHAQRLHMLEQK